jgi:hypothetical protein
MGLIQNAAFDHVNLFWPFPIVARYWLLVKKTSSNKKPETSNQQQVLPIAFLPRLMLW